jgi:molybdate transport system permease protein
VSPSAADFQAFGLTLRLAALATLVLLLVGTPLAWWLAHTRSRWRRPVAALVALPLVLPPTVLGFYLLLLMGPQGAVGRMVKWLGAAPLPFSFRGILIASVVFSLPFVVQPLANAFELVGRRPLESAACLRAGPLDRFFNVALPLAFPGLMSAIVLGFSHTVGEFGVALMVGGNIPGVTRVVSMSVYDRVEAGQYAEAHLLSLLLVVFSFAALLSMTFFRPTARSDV